MREELTQDLKGVFNISDDIIVHGRDTKEHDANLEALLKKTRKKNVTFNKAKCEFNKERVVYYGLTFSKEGVSPDPCKGTGYQKCGPPKECSGTQRVPVHSQIQFTVYGSQQVSESSLQT